jgi:SAM-dependent methyltransferase
LDLVLSTLFFHHLTGADKRRTAKEIARVLKPGGELPAVQNKHDLGGVVEVEVELPTDADPDTVAAHLRAAGRAARSVSA